ncbi:MAG: DMT family transporter [Bacteroidales bacterium]
MNNQSKAMVMGGFVVLFWGTAATAFKIALGGLDYVLLLLIASSTALVISAVEMAITGKYGKVLAIFKDNRTVFKYAAQGLLNPFLYYLVLFKAYSLLPAQIAQPLNYSWQIVLLLMIAVVFKQRLKPIQLIGVVVSFGGILLLSFNSGASPVGTLSFTGIVLALGSAFIWATYWITKINSKEDSSVSLFINFLFGTFYLVLLSLFISFETPDLKPFLAGVYVGCFEMGFTFILWGKALNLATNKVTLAQLTYLAPVLSLILIHFILKEEIGMLTIIGLLFVLGGILIANFKRKERESLLAN